MHKTGWVYGHFVDGEHQRDASTLGMWIFLVTEVAMFGGLFSCYTYFYNLYPEAFHSASRHGDFWLGTINTAVLLTSSLTMALGVHASKANARRYLIACLGLTMVLGIAFLGIKGIEYSHHFHERLFPGPGFMYPDPAITRGAELFFWLYFVMTGLHALHMIIGIAVLGVLCILAKRNSFADGYYTPVEVAGLYWHLVDLVWIFLFPLLYLIGGR
jgi:cytochrome c oxidase subunit III